MISEGSGMQADSMAISTAMPKYPPAEMTEMMKALSAAMILAVMSRRVEPQIQPFVRGIRRSRLYGVGERRSTAGGTEKLT